MLNHVILHTRRRRSRYEDSASGDPCATLLSPHAPGCSERLCVDPHQLRSAARVCAASRSRCRGPRDMRDWTIRLEHPTGTAISATPRILPRVCHKSRLLPPPGKPWPRSLCQTQDGSRPSPESPFVAGHLPSVSSRVIEGLEDAATHGPCRLMANRLGEWQVLDGRTLRNGG